MYYNHVYFILVMYYELVGSFGTCWWLWYLLVALVDGKKEGEQGLLPTLQLLCQLLE